MMVAIGGDRRRKIADERGLARMRTTKAEVLVLIGEGMTEEELELPPSYYLDEADPDVVLLRRQDGTFVAAFSASGATKGGIVGAAEDDHRTLLARGPLPE
jgi:hypothetical protein